MPILHVQLSGQARTSGGQTRQLSPGAVLAQRGPCVQVTVGIANSLASQLIQQGQTLPAPISTIALIDTGASSTCVDEGIALQLSLPVVDVVKVMSASHSSTQQNVYPIHIEFAGIPIEFDVPRAIGAPLAAQGIGVLIGRDALAHCTLFYNGLTGEFTLSI